MTNDILPIHLYHCLAQPSSEKLLPAVYGNKYREPSLRAQEGGRKIMRVRGDRRHQGNSIFQIQQD